MNSKKISVLGAGAWGTALALVLARNHLSVNLWAHEESEAEAIQRDRENKIYLPNISIPDNITCTSNVETAVQDAAFVILVVPSIAFRASIQNLKKYISNDIGIAWATKGLEEKTQKLFSVVAEEELGKKHPFAILSGPSFAHEVAKDIPTAVCVAATAPTFAQEIIRCFHTKHFRVYENNDFVGVQICGAMKNVIAIAAGIADGLGLGENTRAALITRGVAEMARLVKAMGGRTETVMGLAGVGDLVLTASGASRNRHFGMALGQGKSLQEATQGKVIEGLQNAKQFYALMQGKKIELPITESVYRVLYEGLSIQTAVENLLERAPKEEK